MKYFKTTFIWLIVLAAVVGLGYIDFQKTQVEDKKKEELSRLFPFEPPQVVSLLLQKDKDVIELERWEEGWRIIKPIMAKADAAAVEKFLRDVTQTRNDADYVMDPKPTQERLVEFGLATPQVTLTMRVGKQLTPHTLLFGERAPTMGVAFVRLKDKEPVYRALSDARAEADKDVYYFRDKSVLRLNPVMVDQIAVTRDDASYRLRLPDNGRWVIEKPIAARADHGRVFEFMGMFHNAQVKEFIAESKKDLAQYGLDKPQAKLSFWQAGDSEATVSVSVGARNPEKRGYFASMSDRENIFLLEEDLINSIPREAKDLRSRQVLFLENEHFVRIEAHLTGKTVILVRDRDKEWRKGKVDGEKVNYSVVKEILDGLSAIAVRDFVTDKPVAMGDYGLKPPSAQILLFMESSPLPQTLSLGGKTPAGYIYAQSGSEQSILALDENVKGVLNIFVGLEK
jgi:hypothetical protein